MKTLIVIAYILGYILLGIVTTVVHNKANIGMDKEESIAAGVMWPFFWIGLLIVFLSWILFFWWMEKLADWWDARERKKK